MVGAVTTTRWRPRWRWPGALGGDRWGSGPRRKRTDADWRARAPTGLRRLRIRWQRRQWGQRTTRSGPRRRGWRWWRRRGRRRRSARGHRSSTKASPEGSRRKRRRWRRRRLLHPPWRVQHGLQRGRRLRQQRDPVGCLRRARHPQLGSPAGPADRNQGRWPGSSTDRVLRTDRGARDRRQRDRGDRRAGHLFGPKLGTVRRASGRPLDGRRGNGRDRGRHPLRADEPGGGG